MKRRALISVADKSGALEFGKNLVEMGWEILSSSGTAKMFRDAGIPVIVRLDPVLPFVNDSRENLKEVLEACVGASVYGVRRPGPGILLRAAERERFYQKLGEKFPGLPERYRAVYGDAGELMIPHFEELEKYLRGICAGCRMECSSEKLFRWQHAFVDRQAGVQMNLFDLYPEAMRMPQK